MSGTGIITYILIFANFICSYRGFNDHAFFERYKFEVGKVLLYKDYKRLFTSGFLHVGWMHLLFNMFSLYFFSGAVENSLGSILFLVVYFASGVGGNLLSLLVHKNHPDYSSVGASGAVCGIIFAAIALHPGMGIGFFFFPISIPGWVYGILFVLYSIYGIRSRRDNIGHEAHLGGALIGMLIAIVLRPSALTENYFAILIILVPTALFIYLIITRPELLLVDNLFHKTHKDFYSVDHKYNAQKTANQHEIDRILDKITRTGMASLTRQEKRKLKDYSKSLR